MSEKQKVLINLLTTGVPGLDDVLGGGLPEYSFNLIAGVPGAGKTTLAQQIIFANATPERPALYLTVLGEPPLKLLRYQQQFNFFDPEKVGQSIYFQNLSDVVLEHDLGKVLERIVEEVERVNPGIVVVDSFRTVVRAAAAPGTGELELQDFVQRLALHLTTWQATTFLVGEYHESEMQDNPVFTVTDGLFWLFQAVERNSMVRKLQVMKMRGMDNMPGLHTFRIGGEGIRVFPRILKRVKEEARVRPGQRISTGVAELDEMMGGGIPAGDAVIVTGPSGTGKTTLGTQFISAGGERGEAGVIAVFEEHPSEYLAQAKQLGSDLDAMIRAGQLEVIYLRPLDLSVDETLEELRDAVQRLDAKRVLIDSISGFEIALAPTFREDFRESLYRLVGALTDLGVTVMMTVEAGQSKTKLQFTPYAVSFLTDAIIQQRYVEQEGRIRKVMAVIKMRGSAHSHEWRTYRLTGNGVVVGESLGDFRGNVSGGPQFPEQSRLLVYPGLTRQERAVLRKLIERQEASAETLSAETGVTPPEMKPALERLVALNYAVAKVREGRTLYYPVARMSGE